jgi:hypothetical protein
MTTWKDIASAPKDGENIIGLWFEKRTPRIPGYWRAGVFAWLGEDQAWVEVNNGWYCDLLYWMSLPPPPEER